MSLDPNIQAKSALLTQASGPGKMPIAWSASTVAVSTDIQTAAATGTLTAAQVATLFGLALTSVAATITASQGS